MGISVEFQSTCKVTLDETLRSTAYKAKNFFIYLATYLFADNLGRDRRVHMEIWWQRKGNSHHSKLCVQTHTGCILISGGKRSSSRNNETSCSPLTTKERNLFCSLCKVFLHLYRNPITVTIPHSAPPLFRYTTHCGAYFSIWT